MITGSRSLLRAVALSLALAAAGAGCGRREPGGPRRPALPAGFVDRAREAGLTFENHTGVFAEKPFLILSKGGGCLCLDYDGDGDLDLYFVDGNSFLYDPARRTLTRRANPRAGNRLLRNDGGWRFTDVTAAAGVGDTSFGIGGAVGDYDNDGDPDLYVCNWGRNVLYRNNGDGTFTDVTDRAGVGGDERLASTCAALFDADGDGDLDLYVSNYGDVEELLVATGGKPLGVTIDGIFRYSGPGCYTPQADLFFENRGDGTFRDVSAAALRDQVPSYGFQPVPFDADNDGDLDLYVANDSKANFLWINDGSGRFVNRALAAGTAVSDSGDPQAGMGVDAADYDQDGRLDLVVTNFAEDRNTLYRNRSTPGCLFFEDVSAVSGVGRGCWDKVSWGVGFVDFDLDGRLDLFVSNGHVYPTPRQGVYFMGGTYRQTPLLFLGRGPPSWRFENVTAGAGPGLHRPVLGRGCLFGDFDNDGDADVFITCLNERPLLLENRLPRRGHGLTLSLAGVKSNRDAVGARVTVEAGGGRIRQMRELHLAGSFAASRDPRMIFGLGAARKADRVTVRWPSGTEQVFRDVPGDAAFRLVEGREELERLW